MVDIEQIKGVPESLIVLGVNTFLPGGVGVALGAGSDWFLAA